MENPMVHKAFYLSVTFWCVVLAVGVTVLKMFHVALPLIGELSTEASQIIDLLAAAGVLYGRSTATGGLTLGIGGDDGTTPPPAAKALILLPVMLAGLSLGGCQQLAPSTQPGQLTLADLAIQDATAIGVSQYLSKQPPATVAADVAIVKALASDLTGNAAPAVALVQTDLQKLTDPVERAALIPLVQALLQRTAGAANGNQVVADVAAGLVLGTAGR